MPSLEHENATAVSSPANRKKRIHELVVAVGGYEESVRLAMEYRDEDVLDAILPLKKQAYQRLKRYIQYGDEG